MLLNQFSDPNEAQRSAVSALQLINEMYPICRSITGDGVRRTFDLIEQRIALERSEVPSGTAVFDWIIPPEWNIRDAFVADEQGRRVVDFRASNLHVVGYSTPINQTMSLAELEPHLHSLPDRPDRIPYRTSYYREDWGFCLRHRDREQLGPGPYRVVIDSTLRPGSLTYAEHATSGYESGEAIIYTHTCHPSLANDNLTGIAVATLLAQALREERPRLTWRFVFGPGTIGSLTWLARNEQRLPAIRAGLTVGLMGDSQPLTFKRSRRGNSMTDRAGEYVVPSFGTSSRVVDFEPYGYDERQFCSPGFDLPVGRLSRATHGDYPEYHTSADDPSLISADALAESIAALSQLIAVIDCNRRLLNMSPKGEPQLGHRGLYASLGGGQSVGQSERALLWVLSLSDGAHDLLSIAQRSGLDFASLDRAASALEKSGLVKTLPEPAS